MPSILVIIVQAALAVVTSRIVYLCYFHPLARYPGPFWARFTDLWRFLTFRGGKLHLSEKHLHDKYGHVVRVAPNWLSFSNLDGFETIYGVYKSIEKGDFYTFGRGKLAGPRTIFSLQSADLHRERKRKIVGSALSSVKGSRYSPIIEKHVDTLLSRIEALSNMSQQSSLKDGERTAVNIAPLVHGFTMDTLLEVIYGPALPSHPFTESEIAGDICSSVRKTNKSAWSRSLWPIFGWVMTRRPADSLFQKPSYNEHGDVVGIPAVVNAGRVAVNKNKETFVATAQPGVLKSWLEVPVDEGMAPGEISGEAANLVFAGTGSTAAGLTAVLFQLGTEEGQKWQQIIREKTHAAQDTSGALLDLELQAVIKETLRYRAPFSTAFPRVIMPGAETVIPGLSVPLPVGTTVSSNTYVLGRSPEIWGNDADQWVPRRWLGDEQHRRTMENKFVAFSKGSRSCPGKDLAGRVIATAVTAIIQRGKLKSVGDLLGESYIDMQYDQCCIEYAPLSS